MLGGIYVILFVLQVFWLIRVLRKKKQVGFVLMGNILSVALSVILMWYFDTLPGFGMFPGFAFFPEVFYSLCAIAAFTVLTFVTLLCWLLRMHK
jgi:hypothetical protein